MIRQTLFILTLTLGLAGCTSLDPMGAVRTATNEAGAAAGRTVGEAIGEAIVRRYSPGFTNWYAGYLTQMAWGAQGYSVESATRGYEPGEYTEWAVVSEDEDAPTNRMYRALLKREADGDEWWQVIYDDNASDDTIIMEALFSEDREQMLRLRARFPDDEEAQELPVEDQNYQAPVRLTSESIEGASEGTERISVPAGTFEATRIRFGGGGLDQLWWLTDAVPGGIVRQAYESREDTDAPDEAEGVPTENYVLELQDHGSNATSRLGSF